eukprot:TRINITY_DN12870_c0_g1_i1.p1 TRINITY_DN12870_c0_g1~~TRINITY_DN12870_c0_g1_i1.p1  ORF type:complete len:230 (+),score=10.13 TRINITY_DN12870_c0_g1_i1:148-837(+)
MDRWPRQEFDTHMSTEDQFDPIPDDTECISQIMADVAHDPMSGWLREDSWCDSHLAPIQTAEHRRSSATSDYVPSRRGSGGEDSSTVNLTEELVACHIGETTSQKRWRCSSYPPDPVQIPDPNLSGSLPSADLCALNVDSTWPGHAQPVTPVSKEKRRKSTDSEEDCSKLRGFQNNLAAVEAPRFVVTPYPENHLGGHSIWVDTAVASVRVSTLRPPGIQELERSAPDE